MRGITIVTLVVLGAIAIGVGLVPTTPPLQGNEIRAEQLATRLLAEAPLPHSATRAPLALADQPMLGSPHPAIPGAVVARRVYLAPGSEDAVFDDLATHVPPGLTNEERGSGYAPTTGYVEDLVDQVPSTVPPIIAAQLSYAVTAHGANEVLVVIEAFVAWNPDRPATEVVPENSGSVDVSLSHRSAPAIGGVSVLREAVTDPATIERFRSIVDGLPVGRSIVILGPNCDEIETWRLSFSRQRGQAPTFELSASSCRFVPELWQVSVGGHGSSPLSDWKSQLFDAVAPLFGSGSAAGELEAGSSGAPLAGVVTFRNADGVERSAHAGTDGEFSLSLPYGLYRVTALPAGRGRPCTLLDPETEIDPAMPNATGRVYRCSASAPTSVPSAATADGWFKNGGRSLLTRLRSDVEGIIHAEQSPSGKRAAPSSSCAALLSDVRQAATPAARGAANSLTPALGQRWHAITGGAGALAISCNTLEPALVLRNAEQLEGQLRTFSSAFRTS